MKLKLFILTLISFLFISFGYAEKKVYSEDEFLSLFNGKPKARVEKYLVNLTVKRLQSNRKMPAL